MNENNIDEWKVETIQIPENELEYNKFYEYSQNQIILSFNIPSDLICNIETNYNEQNS